MDLIFNLLFIFTLGLIVGSFLNCVIYRLEAEGGPRRKASFLRGRSFCPHCEHTLNWQDLIPVLSFVYLGGRCRFCRKPISWQYPLVEISTGLLFVLVFSTFSWPYSIFYFLISVFLIVIFVYDLKHYLIPDRVIYPAIGLTLVYNFWVDFWMSDIPRMSDILISAFGAAGFFATIVLFSKGRWMGAGDIKLAFLMGLMLGFPDILVALNFAFLSGAAIGVGLILANKKSLKSAVPFGPFLAVGTFVALFWGEKIINWYLNFYV